MSQESTWPTTGRVTAEDVKRQMERECVVFEKIDGVECFISSDEECTGVYLFRQDGDHAIGAAFGDEGTQEMYAAVAEYINLSREDWAQDDSSGDTARVLGGAS